MDKSVHGFHRKCYQAFTYLKYIQTIQHAEIQQEEKNDTDKPSTSKRRRISDAESPRILFPADTCIICDKKQKRLRGCTRYEKLVKCLTSDAETSIKQAATQAQEIEVIGRVQEDLRARETYYHESCRQSRLVKVKRRTQAAPKEDSNTAKKKAAHEDAFSHVCGYIEDRIISASQVERMTMLREWFCSYMQEKHPDYYNPNYTTQKTEEENSNSVWHKEKVLDFRLQKRACVFCKSTQRTSCRKCVCRSSVRRKENRGYKHNVKLKNDRGHHSHLSHYLKKTKPPEILINFVKILLAGKKKI